MGQIRETKASEISLSHGNKQRVTRIWERMKLHLKLRFLLGLALLGGTALTGTAHAGRLAELHQQAQNKNSVAVTKPYAEPQPHGISEIGLERTMCFGTCPNYTVIIQSDGKVFYNGGQFAPRKGKFTGKVSSWGFDQLARYISDSQFSKFADSYTIGVTDNPTVYTSIVTNGKRKIVSNYARSGPASLWAMETLIDNLVEQTVWDEPVVAPAK